MRDVPDARLVRIAAVGQIELSPVKAFGVGGDVLDARWVKIAAAGQAEFVRKSKHVGAERLMPGNSCLG